MVGGPSATDYGPVLESEQEAWIASVVRHVGQLSRAELGRRTGLSRGALAAPLKALQDKRLVEELGPGPSAGGRPPGLLTFGKDSGYLVGAELGATGLNLVLTNLNLEVLASRAIDTDVVLGPGAILPEVIRLVDELLAEAAVDRRIVKGIGMGVPGPVEFKTARAISPPIMPGWHLFPIREYLEAEFGWPVFVDNEVNLMALGSRWAGPGRDVENFIFVKIGTGIGCGIICQGQIYRGADGSAGDIGHIEVTNEPVICRCGNVGCLEAVAGGAALARAAQEAALEGRSIHLTRMLSEKGTLSAADVGVVLGFGDPFAVELVRRAGATIGHVLASLVNFYNPSLIIIGGGVSKLGDIFLASIRETVYKRSLPLATRHIRIQQSELGDVVGAMGAAAMVLEERFQIRPVAP
jgi:glucokinase-like ROK family protein